MKKSLIAFADSRLVFVGLLLSAGLLAFSLYSANAASAPPPIPGYNWVQHSDALLIAVPPDDCGCGQSLGEWISNGTSRRLDVLIVSAKPNPDLDTLKKAGFPSGRVAIHTNITPSLIQKLSPNGQTTVLRIQNGRIQRRFAGGVPPKSFWN